MQQQQTQQRPLLDPPERHRPAIIKNLKRAENVEVQARGTAGHGPTYRRRGRAGKPRRRPVSAPSEHRQHAVSAPTHDRCQPNERASRKPSRPGQEAVMSPAIPAQHPAVVLRSHYNHLRTLLAVAIIAIAGLSAAVVILATNDQTTTQQLREGDPRPHPGTPGRRQRRPVPATPDRGANVSRCRAPGPRSAPERTPLRGRHEHTPPDRGTDIPRTRVPGPRSADRLPRPLRKAPTRTHPARNSTTARCRNRQDPDPSKRRPSAAGGPFRYASHTTSNP